MADEQADLIEVDAEVAALSERVRPHVAPVEAVTPAARPDWPPPVRSMETRASSPPPMSKSACAERHDPVWATDPLDDDGDVAAVEAAPSPARLPVPLVASAPAFAEADTQTILAGVRNSVAAVPPDVAATAAMPASPTEAPDDPATTPVATPVAPASLAPERMDRQVSVSIGRVVVEWIDPPVNKTPAVAAPPAPARTRGFTGIAAARRGVLR